MLAAQKSTAVEVQQMLRHMHRQWNEQKELFEMALRAPHVVEPPASHNPGLTLIGSPQRGQVSIGRLEDAVFAAIMRDTLHVTAPTADHGS